MAFKKQFQKLHDEDYDYILKSANGHTIKELEGTIKDLKKEQYHDYKGNAGLIATVERAIDVKKAIETRENFKNGTSGIENVYWSPFERVNEAEEASYLNLVDSYYEN